MKGERRKNYLFKHLYLYVGESLGDILACNGIVHHMADKTETLIVHANPIYKDCLECMFSDFPNILPLTQEEFKEYQKDKPSIEKIIAPGVSGMPIIFPDGSQGSAPFAWERQHYENFDLPFSMRYKNFHMPKHIPNAQALYEKLTEGEKDYIVVNRFMGYPMKHLGYHVDMWNPKNYKVIELHPAITSNVFDFVELFRHAKQIHVVPTSIHQLVDSMTHEIQGELFFHNIRANFYSPVNCQFNEYRWIIIDYLDKAQ